MHKSHKIYNRVVYSFPYIRHNRNNRWLRNVPYINKTWNYGALLFMIFPALSCVLFYWFFSLSYSYKYTACMCRHFEYIWDSSCCIFPHFSMRKIILGCEWKREGWTERISLIMQKFQFYYDFYLTWLIAFVKKGKVLFLISI